MSIKFLRVRIYKHEMRIGRENRDKKQFDEHSGKYCIFKVEAILHKLASRKRCVVHSYQRVLPR